MHKIISTHFYRYIVVFSSNFSNVHLQQVVNAAFPCFPCLLLFTLPAIEVTDRVLLHIINTLFTSSHWLTLMPALLRVMHCVHSCCSLTGLRPTDLYPVMIFFSISNTIQKETAAEIHDLASHSRLQRNTSDSWKSWEDKGEERMKTDSYWCHPFNMLKEIQWG